MAFDLSVVMALPVTAMSVRPALLSEHRFSALDHGDIARLYLCLKRNHVAVLPHFHCHSLAGIYRRGKACDVLPERRWIVICIRLQDTPTGDPVGAHAVQDRPWKPGAPGEFGIGVQWIAVTAQAINQGLIRTGRNVDGLVGGAGRDFVRLGLTCRGSTETSVATREPRRNKRRERFAIFVLQHGLVPDHRALLLALVENVDNAGVGADMH